MQHKYSLDLLWRVGMLKCKTFTTPMSAIDTLPTFDGDLLPPDDANEYRNIMCALYYLTITRHDISFAVNHVCQYLRALRDTHRTTVERILCYVRLSASYGLHLRPPTFGMLSAF
jgi:hypothetical protein